MRLLTEELREKLAELEHIQWQYWAKVRNPEHPLLNVPYADLTEAQKDQDREWADKSLSLTLKAVKEAINDYTHNKISFERLAELLEINLYELDIAFRKQDTETRKVTLMAVGEWLDKGIVKDLDGNRIRRQSLYPSEKDIEALKRGEMPK